LGEDAFFAALRVAGALVGADGDVAGEADRDDLALGVLAADDDEVADAALSELALDARHPGAAGAAVRAGGVQEDARVANVLAAVGAPAPFVFHDQVIILVRLGGGDVAEAVAGDVQEAVLHGEPLARVFALGI